MQNHVDKTLVLQSHRTPLPFAWVESCLSSVRDWCDKNQYSYRFLGDELFDAIPASLREKNQRQRVILTDLARLLHLQQALNNGFDTVVWLDADFLIFDPASFVLPESACAVGREIWIQEDDKGKLKVYKKVHNACLLFRKGNSLLDFYTDTAMRLLSKCTDRVPAQFIGPKLLTALHNIADFPVMETAGMLSPLVVRDLAQGGGPALELFEQHSPKAISGANLCISSCESGSISESQMETAIDVLTGVSSKEKMSS